MPDVLQPEQTSRENIQLFFESIEDEGLRRLLEENLEQILEIGAGRGNREAFFVAVSNLIEEKLRGENENQDD
jgi:hypothetical protein